MTKHYVAIHKHNYGSTCYSFCVDDNVNLNSFGELLPNMIAKALDIPYEPEIGEFIDIEDFDNDTVNISDAFVK